MKPFSLPLLLAVFLRIVITPVLLCVSLGISVCDSNFPRVRVYAKCLEVSLAYVLVGFVMLVFSLLPVHHIRGLLECGHLLSVSHVLAIVCAFALRECISLVSQPFQHNFICHLVLPCDSQNTSEAAHVKHIQHFLLVCMHCPRLTS